MFRRFRYLILIPVATGTIVCGGVFWFRSPAKPNSRELLQAAAAALTAGEPAQAEQLARQVLEKKPHHIDALLLTAQAARAQNKQRETLASYAALPEEARPLVIDNLNAGAELALQWGQLQSAEQLTRRVLILVPQHREANIRLAYLLGVEGRCEEAVSPLLTLIQLGQFGLHHLVLLGASDPVIADTRLVDLAKQADPDYAIPQIGPARTAISKNDLSQARKLLEVVVREQPQSAEGQAQWGQVLQATDDPSFSVWSSSLPKELEWHPGIWIARGLWLRDHGQPEAAARCLWEAVRRDSEQRVPNLQLGQTLVALGETEAAQPFLKRGQQLLELAQVVDDLYSHPNDTQGMQRASQISESLGRLWEAWGWAMLAATIDPGSPWPREVISRLQPQLAPTTPRTLANANPAAHLNLTRYELPDWNKATLAQTDTKSSGSKPITFLDEAKKRGIDFIYRTRGPSEKGEMRMYESDGGGVGVLDYDGDHFPDLYLTQGGRLKAIDQSQGLNNRLYRNQDAARFDDVTTQSGLGSLAYGQGTTVGDFNNDGFPDLYIANLGRNQLYQNMGDGTFEEVNFIPQDAPDQWTSSCLIADLNGDSLPDLYDVNYLSLKDALQATCREGEELQWCNPSTFAASQDRLYLNQGDGSFTEISKQAGIEIPDGKGLGIVAADFDGSGKLSLFVANDAVANFYFQNETSDKSSSPRFSEMATSLGLAYDANGLPQACMGVAAGDLNGDRRLDLFVTNFYDQSNTLYLNQPGTVFVDATARSGLKDPGYYQLGFGTQPLDADLDGWLDLVVTNGHVLNLSAKGTPWQMRPQFFRNLGEGKFSEVSASEAGPFFEKRYLGRGLVKLDWNRDGRPDYVVSHINDPASLVTNTTNTPHHFLALKLHGVDSSRDAIGAIVTVNTGSQTLLQQLTAGDGFQASNERELLFGLGDVTIIPEVTVRWPSGKQTHLKDVAADQRLTLIEGASDTSLQEEK